MGYRYGDIFQPRIKANFLLLLFILLCAGCLFFHIPIFNDAATTTKWFWFFAFIFSSGCFLFLWRHKNNQFALTTFDIILFLVWIYFLLLSVIDVRDINAVRFYLSLLILYCLFRLAIKTEYLKSIFFIIGILCFLLALYGMAQFWGFFPTRGNVKILGNFDNPAGYASSLALGLPFVLYFLFEKRKVFKYAAYFILGVIILSILLSASRAGIISTVCASLFFIFRTSKFYEKIKYKRLIYLFVAVILFILFIGLYFVKKDSADGRVLIWNCTGKMITEKPFLGHGTGSFKAKYMLYQADYFKQNPDSSFASLADNVMHPFNEFLLVWVEEGILGLSLLLLVVIATIKLFYKNSSRTFIALQSSLIAIFIFSCFSYPMNYPFSWIILILCFTSLANLPEKAFLIGVTFKKLKLILCSVSILSAFCFFPLMKQLKNEYQWCKIARKSFTGHAVEMIPEYDKLFPDMQRSPLFLYNYAAELNHIEEYKKSKELILLCEAKLNDYDIQLLAANNYLQL